MTGVGVKPSSRWMKCFDPVCGQNLQCDSLRRPGKRVSVFAHKQRASYSLVAPVFADGLSNGKDMRLGKRRVRTGAAMPACAEADELIRVGGIGLCLRRRQLRAG